MFQKFLRCIFLLCVFFPVCAYADPASVATGVIARLAGANSVSEFLATSQVGAPVGILAVITAGISGSTQGGFPVDAKWKGRWVMTPAEQNVPAGWTRDPVTGEPVPPQTSASVTPLAGAHVTSGTPADLCKTTGNGRPQYFLYARYVGIHVPSPPLVKDYMCNWNDPAICGVGQTCESGGVHDWGPFDCPSGYAMVSGSCALSDASKVTAPSAPGDECVIVRKGNSFSAQNSEACEGVNLPLRVVDAQGNTISVTSDGFTVVPAGKDKASAWGEVSADGKTMTVTQNTDATKDYPAGATVMTTITNTATNSTVTNQAITQGVTDHPATDAGAQEPAITCEQIGTCGVALDSTLHAILDAVTGKDMAEVGDTTIDIPDPDVSFFDSIALPILNIDILGKLFPPPRCTDPHLVVSALFVKDVPVDIPYCDTAEKVRPYFAWLWYGLTVIIVVRILAKTRPSEVTQ